VELLDLYPTVVALAGLPPPPKAWELPGSDLTLGMQRGNVVKPIDAAFGQITRCVNCSLAYGTAVGIRGAYRKPLKGIGFAKPGSGRPASRTNLTARVC
jgi:hypothetical protein